MATPLGLSSYHRAQSLGDGAFGAVVAVYDDDGSQFALKSFDEAESDAEDESMDLGLIREVSALRLLMAPSLAHRGVMPLRDITVVGGVVSLVMPMYPMNIGKAIETKAVGSRPEKIRVAFELLSALAFLHDNGVIHRDIKPDNIMMDDGLSPVLIDFSLAKQLSPSELLTAATHSGNVGTACYISPECYASEPYAAECDSYSAGVVLLELFRGERLSCERDKAALALVQRYANTP
jgi:serine/threonine protein kinase